ncbi:TRAP transporter substrate-binding protein [Halanaerobium salsuginis]|jgi:tripartite ATP-independent transporter DctP family solute receptor|uniref:Tripartite ATP-independent transporter solute receptor, DctP family n=1 Tax=Halanaerobium salsuginis TaxID=29563 RepID=A0A1I4JJS3_9FIRM|nr:TRAP transporter substrate-binding protein [Halanaerobium salsuginis]SFL66744.1 tripartite ATP-independent transporter solute receptor, DctP family [Halanaerobium salsuginis]
MQKKRIIMVFLLVIIVILVTISYKDLSNADTQYYAWPLGTASPEDTVTNIFARKFAQEVNELSDGKMKIEVYGNSVIGTDRELLESCKNGDIPFVAQNTAPQVTFMPEIAVFDIPSAFSSIDEVRATVDNQEFNNYIQEVYQKAGYKLLAFADQGFRVMTTNKRIDKLADFNGLKIRTMGNTYHLAFWKSLGANPTPMSFSEVYIGLQQGTIDAQENPYEVIASSKLYEQQKYLVKTNHLPHLISLIVSDEFYQGLPADEQKIIDKAAKIAQLYARQTSDQRIESKLKLIEEKGTEVIEVSDELYKEINERSIPVYEKIRNEIGDEVTGLYIKESKNYHQ